MSDTLNRIATACLFAALVGLILFFFGSALMSVLHVAGRNS